MSISLNSNKIAIRDIDAGQPFDWGSTSEDYARHRPGPPSSFYEKLIALGIGTKDQAMLDLGTGTGVVIREFFKRGVKGFGVDISAEQINVACALAKKQGLSVTFKQSPAESIPFSDHSFDVVIANQCWWYFDLPKVIPEIRRVLKPGGLLVVSHFNYSPRLDAKTKYPEDLVLKYNPKWTGADWDCDVPAIPSWAIERFKLRGMFYYDEAIPFTHESWRGRMRACRGVAASLSQEAVAAFDLEHATWLKENVADPFDVLHRIDAHILQFKEDSVS